MCLNSFIKERAKRSVAFAFVEVSNVSLILPKIWGTNRIPFCGLFLRIDKADFPNFIWRSLKSASHKRSGRDFEYL